MKNILSALIKTVGVVIAFIFIVWFSVRFQRALCIISIVLVFGFFWSTAEDKK